MGSQREFTKLQGCTNGVKPRIHRTPRVHHWGSIANSQNPKGAPLGYHCEFTKPQGCTIGVPKRIHKTPRMHHWGPTANSQNPKCALLLSHREFTKPQGCTIGVPPRIHKTTRVYHWTPIVHPCGFVISRWDPNGASLGFREFAVGPAQLGSHRELTKPQGCTIGVPLRIKKTPRVHN